jgi:pyruvate ferredoxin oxidoreductase delta subunit
MKWDISGIETWPWHRHPLGLAGLDPGNSLHIKTGSWRTLRPIRDGEKCNHCLLCFIFCPDSAIQVSEGRVTGINYDYCKGCGICAEECGRKALTMVEESAARK